MNRLEKYCPLLFSRGRQSGEPFCKRDLCAWWISCNSGGAHWPDGTGSGHCAMQELAGRSYTPEGGRDGAAAGNP